MKFITLRMIIKEQVSRGGQIPQAPSHSYEPSGEDDGIESMPDEEVAEVQPAAQVVSIAPTTTIVEEKPVTIGVDSIRNFYPRKDNVPGTRVILKSGVAYVVAETHEEVLSKINTLG